MSAAGTDKQIIATLLNDTKLWNALQIRLKSHILISRNLMTDVPICYKHRFRERTAHYQNLIDNSAQPRIAIMEQECGDAITNLKNDTNEMIQRVRILRLRNSRGVANVSVVVLQEFNLVSIHEAQKSLQMARRALELSERSMQMSIISNGVAISMKRLSWITVRLLRTFSGVC